MLVVALSLAVLAMLAFAVSLVALCESGQGAGTGTRPGRRRRQPPLTNYRFLGIDESSSSAHRPVRTSEKPMNANFC